MNGAACFVPLTEAMSGEIIGLSLLAPVPRDQLAHVPERGGGRVRVEPLALPHLRDGHGDLHALAARERRRCRAGRRRLAEPPPARVLRRRRDQVHVPRGPHGRAPHPVPELHVRGQVRMADVLDPRVPLPVLAPESGELERHALARAPVGGEGGVGGTKRVQPLVRQPHAGARAFLQRPLEDRPTEREAPGLGRAEELSHGLEVDAAVVLLPLAAVGGGRDQDAVGRIPARLPQPCRVCPVALGLPARGPCGDLVLDQERDLCLPYAALDQQVAVAPAAEAGLGRDGEDLETLPGKPRGGEEPMREARVAGELLGEEVIDLDLLRGLAGGRRSWGERILMTSDIEPY